MAQFNYIKTRAKADALIRKFGMKAVLRRMSDIVPDRECWVVMTNYMTKDAESQLANPTARQVYIAAGLGAVLSKLPDSELDQLVTFVQPLGTTIDEILPFTAPVKPIRPAGVTVVYETTVRR